MKTIKLLACCIAGGLVVSGCATAKIDQTVTETTKEGVTTSRDTQVRVRTFFDSKSELSKLKTTNTDKTQSIGIDALNQQSSGTNVVDAVSKISGAVVEAAIKATTGK